MTTLDAVPDIEMLVYLPEILDGLLIILGDQNQEIRQMWVSLDNHIYSIEKLLRVCRKWARCSKHLVIFLILLYIFPKFFLSFCNCFFVFHKILRHNLVV